MLLSWSEKTKWNHNKIQFWNTNDYYTVIRLNAQLQVACQVNMCSPLCSPLGMDSTIYGAILNIILHGIMAVKRMWEIGTFTLKFSDLETIFITSDHSWVPQINHLGSMPYFNIFTSEILFQSQWPWWDLFLPPVMFQNITVICRKWVYLLHVQPRAKLVPLSHTAPHKDLPKDSEDASVSLSSFSWLISHLCSDHL